jgi:7-cyano-7-deazaguanine synthase in queuosine biosynthesis
MQYKNTFGKIQVMKDEELFRGKTLALSMSGGADSTILCYILAKTSQKRNLQITIQPYNGYDMWASMDSKGVVKIIKYIQSKFPNVDIQWPISTVFDTNGDFAPNDKNMYITPLIEKLVAHNVVDLVMNGISMGPPLEVQQTFKDWDNKINVRRLPGYHLWNEVERAIDHLSPLKHIDKRFIVYCYKKFGIEELLEMTNSCTEPQGNCRECWWCQERSWALEQTLK